MDLRDVHNLLASLKHEGGDGKTDESRAVELLREFCDSDGGNSAAISADDSSGLVHAVCFQTASQKRLFKAFPEVVLVDTTHGTNKNCYKLFSFLVNDVFGKVKLFCTKCCITCPLLYRIIPDALASYVQGQYVHHALVESETKDILLFCVNEFKQSNPAWSKIQVVVTDKDFKEKDVLAEAFPDARQLLCQFHVIDYLRKQVGSRRGYPADNIHILTPDDIIIRLEVAATWINRRNKR